MKGAGVAGLVYQEFIADVSFGFGNKIPETPEGGD